MLIKFFSILLITFGVFTSQSIYNYTITTINGANKPLSVFKGRKILIVTLPVAKTLENSAFLKKVDSISKVYEKTLSIIAVPSFEDGYSVTNAASVRNYYNALLGQQVTITEGMFTHNSSPSQDPLFVWLTHSEKNGHFDCEVEDVGQKFFITEQGELYGIASPKVELSAKLLSKMIQ